MKIIKQLFWVFLFLLLGEGISLLLADYLVVPGSVVGMLLLFFVLHFDWLALEKVDEVGSWLTDNMAIFFVPAGVGLITNFDLLAEFWLQLLVIVIVTVVIMMTFVGKVVGKIIGESGEKNEKLEGGDLND